MATSQASGFDKIFTGALGGAPYRGRLTLELRGAAIFRGTPLQQLVKRLISPCVLE